MMKQLLTKRSDRALISAEAGNKARFLFELDALGVPVPTWVGLGARLFRQHLVSSGARSRAEVLLAAFEPARAELISTELVRMIVDAPLASEAHALIAEGLSLVSPDGRAIAVRSSGREEDGAAFSFAGQFDSFLGMTGLDAVLDSVKRCWASAFSSRSLLYRHRHGLPFGDVEMGVVLQQLVHADTSGVTFSVNPATGNPFEIVTSAVYGLGEGLVSGAVDADVFTADKYTGDTKSTVVGGKHQRFDAQGVSDVPVAERSASALQPAQLEELRQVALTLESAFGSAQDIEWCFEKGRLWLLQARPVTGAARPLGSHFEIWDNSNIIENYPGITSHLTFTFARHLYGQVFLEYCKLLLIPEEHLREMTGFLENLLGYVNGRVYYNLLHWYKLVGVNPLQTLGRKMMEVQMGVGQTLDLDEAEALIEPYHPRSRAHFAAIRAVSGARFFSLFAASELHVRRFRSRFQSLFTKYDALDYDSLPPEVVFRQYKAFERAILSIWGITVSLESAIGLPYGVLRMLTQRWIGDAPPWFEAGVVGGISGVESIEPARRMSALAELARHDDELLRVIASTPSSELRERLDARTYPAFVASVNAYIRDFGYRANNELKLEEPDMNEDPAVLFDMLKATLPALRNGHAQQASSTDERVTEILRSKLNPAQRAVFQAVRSLVRGAIRRRETVRFCRSRTFGVFRRMFVAMGRGLAAQGVLEQHRDVFHLTREELDGCFDAGVSHREIKAIVARRQSDAEAYAAMPELPARFVTRGPVVTWAKWFEASAARPGADVSGDAGDRLRGTACSPGIASGVARVVKEPSEFEGGVLVTYRTDPGWIAVFPSANALLVERGSPLTHAAIVARELGIPTIVQIPGLTKRVQSGMELEIDANQGLVRIVSAPLARATEEANGEPSSGVNTLRQASLGMPA